MRDPDIDGPQGAAWKVPLDRMTEWADEHQELIHQASRGAKLEAWRDLWYVRRFVPRDLDAMEAHWVAVLMRDLRADPDVERWYAEAEWDLVVLHCDPNAGTPPVNGDGMFEWDTEIQPPIMYQFHGLTDRQVLELGDDPRRPITFAQFLVEALCAGAVRQQSESWAHHLSRLVNGIRAIGYAEGEPARRELLIDERTGLLIETEDGSFSSLAEVVPGA